MDDEKLRRSWRLFGVIALVLAIVLVAGPQLIDLVYPDFR